MRRTRAPVSLLLGPSTAFRTQAEFEASGQSVDIKDETTSTDMGLVAGIAVSVDRRIVIDGRHMWGLRNINKDASDGDDRNRTLSLTVGWCFR